ncbi:killer cell lectin-like receptor subfamily B member 1B allele A [Mizuhopecten yessoensis]|uniref:Killer cell lectin-like receptor subfamily B member 1B allele A n=1 Tax=Mizuhopecten yessoensis TaxID=6573 RepID=A0A210QSJ1_MIZYE|nr:killer cell lectin-like receptor subfamily B member 1B allele A [Mizuhopecten yessoensis]OWF51695.1 Killer cell lectin-like receptor subfamily B member 1B allele A [Mizuhopecten yessoensis]
MKACMVIAGLILISMYDQVFSDDNDSVEKVEEQSLTSELVNLLNGTYFNLNEKVCQLQRKVDAIERVADPDHQCECNETEINEFKQAVSDELNAFSKILSGFENQMRLLQNEQAELRELIGGGDSDDDVSTTTTTTTTPAPRICDPGWFSSPEKCYYVSSTSEKTEWSMAMSRCTAKGANLVEIQTDKEASFIMRNLPSRVGNTDILYTGRKRNDRDGWVFVSNDKMVDTSVRTWASGEPDGGSQRCGCTRQSESFMMLDCYCTGYNLFFICEIER